MPKRIFNLAVRDELVTKNPCLKVKRIHEDNARDRILSQDEFRGLLVGLPPHAANIVMVGYYTGMRFGEIVQLTWDRVNLEEGYFNLTPQNTKTREPRHVYFPQVIREMIEVLKTRDSESAFVFTYKGRPIKSIKKSFDSALKKAGINDFHFHDLRHTYVTNLRKAGVDPTVIMKLTGHKTLSMFTRYNTVDQVDAKEAIEKFNNLMGGREEEIASKLLHKEKGVTNVIANPLNFLTPRARLELATWWLTATRSAD